MTPKNDSKANIKEEVVSVVQGLMAWLIQVLYGIQIQPFAFIIRWVLKIIFKFSKKGPEDFLSSPDMEMPPQGAKPFQEDQHQIFRELERKGQIQKLVGHLNDQENSLIVVRGKPYSGKTSLLRAGLRGSPEANDASVLSILATFSGSNAMDELVRKIKPDHEEKIRSGKDLLELLAKRRDGKKVLLVLDQFQQISLGKKENLPLVQFLGLLVKKPLNWITCYIGTLHDDPNLVVFTRNIGVPEFLDLKYLSRTATRNVLNRLANASGIILGDTLIKKILDVRGKAGPQPPLFISILIKMLWQMAERRGNHSVSWEYVESRKGIGYLFQEYLREIIKGYPVKDFRKKLNHLLIAVEILPVEKLTKAFDLNSGDLSSVLKYLTRNEVRVLRKEARSGRYWFSLNIFKEEAMHLDGLLNNQEQEARDQLLESYEAWCEVDRPTQGLLTGRRLNEIRNLRHLPYLLEMDGQDSEDLNHFIEESIKRHKLRRKIFSLSAIAFSFLLIFGFWVNYIYKCKQQLSEDGLPRDLVSWVPLVKKRPIKILELSDATPHSCWLGKDVEELVITGENDIDLGTLPDSLKKLQIRGVPLENIEDIGHLKNLVELTIINNNKLFTLKGIPLLEKLHKLQLEDIPHLVDLEKASSLKNLRELYLYDLGKLSIFGDWNVPSLEKLAIGKVGLDVVQIKEFLHKQNSLKYLELNNISIKRTSWLAKFENLKEIRLGYNLHLKSLMGLNNLKGLQKLTIQDCPLIEELDGLADHPSLMVLSLIGNQNLTNFHALKTVGRLRNLTFIDTRLAAIKDAVGLDSNVTKLRLENNHWLQSIEGIETLDLLKELYITNNMLLFAHSNELRSRNLEVISQVRTLRILALGDVPSLGNCKPIQNMVQMEELYLHDRLDLISFDGLENLKNLRILSWEANKEVEIADALKFMGKLNELYLLGEYSLDFLKNIPKPKELEVMSLRSNASLTELLSLGAFSSLRKLDLSGCYNLKSIIGIGVLNKLEEVDLIGVPIKSLDGLPKTVKILRIGK